MIQVGVRELRQSASKLLRRVQRGETIEVTDRGHPVALLTPIPAGSVLETLRAAGQIATALDDFGALPEPVALPEGAESPSEVLARLRHNER